MDMNEAEEADVVDHGPWSLRAIGLLALGALFGLLIHFLTRGAQAWMWTDDPWRMAGATFVGVGGIVFAFSLERLRWAWSAIFAAAAGLVTALVGWWNGAPQNWGPGEGWQFAASLAAVAIAVPLFQAARDAGSRRFATAAVHAYAWSNVILWGAAWAFVGASFLLTLLLSELFRLIGINLLHDLLNEGWFDWTLAGGAFGAAVGLLRDRDTILHTLQKVVRAILSLLAPVLALGLLIFVLALPFTGLAPLWSQTKSTTPIVLMCILGAVVLANAVVGNGADEEARSPVLRYAAMALAAVLLPLAFVAALSVGQRIGQYGYTPDRLWAGVFVAAAAAFAAAYLFALIRGRRGWAAQLRTANVRLAAGLCLLALFLALPIVSFGAISASDQVARLRDGRTPPDRFDWAAMRFDFGPAGRRKLQDLAATGPAQLRARAVEWLKADTRHGLESLDVNSKSRPVAEPSLVVQPAGRAVPDPLRRRIGQDGLCGAAPCRLVFHGASTAVLLLPSCDTCLPSVRIYTAAPEGGWTDEPPPPPRVELAPPPGRPGAAAPGGQVEIRTIEKQQVFVDGQPVGPLFD
jgi:hypothetical protein